MVALSFRQVTLVIAQGNALTIGRGAGVDIRYNDMSVSRLHCEIECIERGNGVLQARINNRGVSSIYVNRERVATDTAVPVFSGDEIRLRSGTHDHHVLYIANIRLVRTNTAGA